MSKSFCTYKFCEAVTTGMAYIHPTKVIREVVVSLYRVLLEFNWLALKTIQTEALHYRDLFYVKRCSYTFHKIYRKTPVPESLFLIKLQALGLQLY